MIDVKNFDSAKLLNGLNVAAAQASNLLEGIDMGQAKDLMSEKQLEDLAKAKKDIAAIKGKDFAQMSAIINKFK